MASGARRSVGPADAGAPAWIAPSSDTAPSESQNLDSNERELPGNAHDHEQSSGWRLGQARRRISMLESRVERYRANLRDLDPSGPASLSAERQRSLLERTEARLRELREQERELAAMARSDGTISDAERGFEEGEHETVRPPVQIPLSSP